MSEEDLTNKQMLEKLMQAINIIKEEGTKNKEELKQEILTINNNLLEKFSEQDAKVKTLSEKCNQLEIRNSKLEKFYRKNNIIISGLELPVDSTILDYTVEKLNTLLGVQLQESDINNIYQLKSKEVSLIKVELLSYLKKELIFKNKAKLKGTKIFIAHDLNIQERQEQKLLVKHLKLARSKSYYANIIGRTLKINNEIYTLEQLRELDRKADEEHTSEDEISRAEQHCTRDFNTKPSSKSEKQNKASSVEPNKAHENTKISRTLQYTSSKIDRVTRNKQVKN